ncbi:MAG TPA: Ig-like domain-containing protein, partial [Acidobacteriaceae bacterium]|nr:Ig-like domain-containing protein [Acidobacteriaceae bacterium]
MRPSPWLPTLLLIPALLLPGRFPAHALTPSFIRFDTSGPIRPQGPAASPAHTPPGVEAEALAPGPSGPVEISVSWQTSNKTFNLNVVVAGQVLGFTLPSRDLTLGNSSLTLNTHGDLKSYGSIQLTWTQTHKPATGPPANFCGGGYGGAPQTWMYYINGKGSAHLKLPCVGQLAPTFSGSYQTAPSFAAAPDVGYFKGVSAYTSVSEHNAGVLLTAWQAAGSSQLDILLQISHANPAAGATLNGHNQDLLLKIPSSSALKVASGLNSATLNLPNGPAQLQGTALTWKATHAPVAVTRVSTCKQTWTGGATRDTSITGTLWLRTCVLSGKFQETPNSYGGLYSNAAKTAPALKLVSTIPANGATNVSDKLTSISATFSNPIDVSSALITLAGSGGDTQTAPASLPANGNKTVQFTLTQPLHPNAQY